MIHFWLYVTAWGRLIEGLIGVLTFGIIVPPGIALWSAKKAAKARHKRRQQPPTLNDLNAFPYWKRN